MRTLACLVAFTAVAFGCKTNDASEALTTDGIVAAPRGDFLCMGPGEASAKASGFLFDLSGKKVYDVTVMQDGVEPNRFPLEILAFNSAAGAFDIRALGGFMGEPRGFIFNLKTAAEGATAKLEAADSMLYDEAEDVFRADGTLGYHANKRAFSCTKP
jgi:hypothetical protein